MGISQNFAISQGRRTSRFVVRHVRRDKLTAEDRHGARASPVDVSVVRSNRNDLVKASWSWRDWARAEKWKSALNRCRCRQHKLDYLQKLIARYATRRDVDAIANRRSASHTREYARCDLWACRARATCQNRNWIVKSGRRNVTLTLFRRNTVLMIIIMSWPTLDLEIIAATFLSGSVFCIDYCCQRAIDRRMRHSSQVIPSLIL